MKSNHGTKKNCTMQTIEVNVRLPSEETSLESGLKHIVLSRRFACKVKCFSNAELF